MIQYLVIVRCCCHKRSIISTAIILRSFNYKLPFRRKEFLKNIHNKCMCSGNCLLSVLFKKHTFRLYCQISVFTKKPSTVLNLKVRAQFSCFTNVTTHKFQVFKINKTYCGTFLYTVYIYLVAATPAFCLNTLNLSQHGYAQGVCKL